MVIDYFNTDAFRAGLFSKSFYSKNRVMPNHGRVVLPNIDDYPTTIGNSKYSENYRYKLTIANPQVKTTVTEKKVERFGLFGLGKREVNVEVEKWITDTQSKYGYALLGNFNLTNSQDVFELSLNHKTSSAYDKQILIDSYTLLPILSKNPSTAEEIKMLLEADPRFVSVLDPHIVIGLGLTTDDIKEWSAQGLKNVLHSQAGLGVPYSPEEERERLAFANEAIGCGLSFVKSYDTVLTGTQYKLSEVGGSELEEGTEGSNAIVTDNVDTGMGEE